MNCVACQPTQVSFPGLGIENLNIDRVAFTVGPFTVYWYGVIIAMAMLLCVVLAIIQSKKYHLTMDNILDYALVCIPAAFVGARLYYVVFKWSYYKDNLSDIIRINDGGLAVIGGVLAAFLAGYILTRIKKRPINLAFDFCIVYIPLGQAIGRWGNFVNQEAFGTNTTLPWGMISERTSAYLSRYAPELDPTIPVHPTFLYESLAALLIFIILLIVRKKSKLAFLTTAGYLILYGVARFFIEGLRTDSLYVGETTLRSSQLASVAMVIVGILLITISFVKKWKSATYYGPENIITEETAVSDNVENDGDGENVKDDE